MDSSPEFSPLLVDLDLGRFLTKSTLNFHRARLFRPYDIVPTRIVHTTKDLRYLLNIYCGISTWTCLFLFLFYWYILQFGLGLGLDSESFSFSGLIPDLDLAVAGLDTRLEIKLGY